MEQSQDDFEEVEKGLYELLKYVFITNCIIDENSMTQEEAKTIEELDSFEILNNLESICKDLLSFKQQNLKSELSELSERAEQFKSMKQKLKTEVRSHQNLQKQLNQNLEESNNKINNLEAQINLLNSQFEELKETNVQMPTHDEELEQKLKMIQEKYMKKLKSFKKFGKENVLPRDLETIELKRTVKERQKIISTLQQEHSQLQQQLNKQDKKYQQLYKTMKDQIPENDIKRKNHTRSRGHLRSNSTLNKRQ